MSEPAALEKPSIVEEPDEQLVRSAIQGEPRAVAQIYKRHSRHLAGIAYRLLGDASELDDVVQETFVAALRHLRALKEPTRLRAWLVMIAIRQVQRRLAARSRRRWLGLHTQLTSAVVSDPNVSREVLDLYRILERVRPQLRVPWILARIEGSGLEEVAALCNVSVATAKRRLANADKIVQRKLRHG